MRMPLRYYLPAAVAGSAVWAVLYATVGLAVVQAWLAAEAGSWWGVAVLVLVVVAAPPGSSPAPPRPRPQSSERPVPLE